MNSRRREARQAATQAFFQSLEELEVSLVSEEGSNALAEQRPDRPKQARPKQKPTPKPAMSQEDFQALEEAVADIEQYVEAQQAHPPEDETLNGFGFTLDSEFPFNGHQP